MRQVSREVVQHLNDNGVAAWPAGQCLPVFAYSTVQVCRPVSGQSCEGKYISCH